MLPDGITHTKGFVKDPDEANRYLSLGDGASVLSERKDDPNQLGVIEKPEDRRTVDLSKNVCNTFAFKLVFWGTLLILLLLL